MNVKLGALCAVLALTGCLSSAPKAPVNWTVEPSAAAVPRVQSQKYGTVRVAQVAVRAPYDGLRLAVLRRDGSVAFDPFNSFASSPSALLRGAAQDVAAHLVPQKIQPVTVHRFLFILHAVIQVNQSVRRGFR